MNAPPAPSVADMAHPSSDPGPLGRVAVVGLGDIGTALAPGLTHAGYQVALVSRRTRADLAGTGLTAVLDDPRVAVVRSNGAAAEADVLLLAVPYRVAQATLSDLGDLTGKIIIDATNYNRDRDGDDLDPGPAGTTSVLRREFPAARWVKAFNMLWAGWLRTDADVTAPYRVVFVAADDPDAKATVAELIRRVGFVPFDTGFLADAQDRQLEGTPAWNQRLAAGDAHMLMPEAPGVIGTSA